MICQDSQKKISPEEAATVAWKRKTRRSTSANISAAAVHQCSCLTHGSAQNVECQLHRLTQNFHEKLPDCSPTRRPTHCRLRTADGRWSRSDCGWTANADTTAAARDPSPATADKPARLNVTLILNKKFKFKWNADKTAVAWNPSPPKVSLPRTWTLLFNVIFPSRESC